MFSASIYLKIVKSIRIFYNNSIIPSSIIGDYAIIIKDSNTFNDFKINAGRKQKYKQALKYQMRVTEEEKEFINNSEQSVFHFRNGINLNDEKHKDFKFRVYFITGLTSLYLEHIEKEWRKNGLPKLCSYLTGR